MATTVGGGVNVPNATIMVIEQAERFARPSCNQLRDASARPPRERLRPALRPAAHSASPSSGWTSCATADDGFIAEKDLNCAAAAIPWPALSGSLTTFKRSSAYTACDLIAIAGADDRCRRARTRMTGLRGPGLVSCRSCSISAPRRC